MTTTDPTTAPSIVLIHGLWMTPLSWEGWVDRYTAKGYRVMAPAWPGVERPIEELRRDPSVLAPLGVTEVADHYERIIRGLDKPPIIMGHSFGGLLTQILIDRGLGAAGVAIDSAPPKGILNLPFSTLKVAFPALSNPGNRNKAKALTQDQFRYAFGNLLSEAESNAVFEKYAIPGPDRMLFQGGFANLNPKAATKVNTKNDTRSPLLLIAGGKDHVAPAALTKANYKQYSKSKALTAYKEYPERSHYTLGQDGWEEVADFALEWALQPRAIAP